MTILKRTWVLLVAASLATTVSADVFKPSKTDQIELGQRAAKSVRKEEKVLPDNHEKVILLRRLADRIVRAIPNAEKEPWKYTFDVIENKEVNAFALPGGPLFFYTGLMTKMSTEDQLAGVIAHEMVHVRNQHWASAYGDNQKRKLGLFALLAILRANQTIFNVASIGDDVVFGLPYSRKHETEADMSGYDLMTNAGFNPRGMVETFEILKRATAGGKPPEILSTHPDHAGRIKRLEDKIKKDTRTFPAQTKLPWEPDVIEPPKTEKPK